MTHDDAARLIARRIADGGIDVLRRNLLSEPPSLPLVPKRGDFEIDARTPRQGHRTLTAAAVLLPIVCRAEPTVLFTRRTLHLSRHAGQVSFPGGRANEGDRSLVDTALRETREETGIAADFVTVAGFLDAYETGTGYAILPVVGVLDEGFDVAPDANEVAEVFEVPLAFLLDPSNRQRESGEWQGRTRHFYAFRYGRHYIWGATAAILVDFGERIIG